MKPEDIELARRFNRYMVILVFFVIAAVAVAEAWFYMDRMATFAVYFDDNAAYFANSTDRGALNRACFLCSQVPRKLWGQTVYDYRIAPNGSREIGPHTMRGCIDVAVYCDTLI